MTNGSDSMSDDDDNDESYKYQKFADCIDQPANYIFVSLFCASQLIHYNVVITNFVSRFVNFYRNKKIIKMNDRQNFIVDKTFSLLYYSLLSLLLFSAIRVCCFRLVQGVKLKINRKYIKCYVLYTFVKFIIINYLKFIFCLQRT